MATPRLAGLVRGAASRGLLRPAAEFVFSANALESSLIRFFFHSGRMALTVLAAWSLFAMPAHAASPTYADQLVARARTLDLANSRAWLALLHVKPSWWGKPASELAGADFFLSPNGATDPSAELEATVRAWFLPMPVTSAPLPGGVTPVDAPRDTTAVMDARGRYVAAAQHAICRFPARFLFLGQQLELDAATLPPVDCPAAQKFLERVQAQSITLVFSGYHLSAPASAFGHIFLRMNRNMDSGHGRSLELLDHAVDYSADADAGNAIAYAIKGLVGAYPGTFHAMPYYYKVREYNDFESRDLWEYDLNLPPDRLLLLLAHVWEVGWAYAPYYYLSGNCAYHIMALLDAVAPRLEASSGLGWPVLPVNSAKRLASIPGLLRQVRFRPSIRRQFEQRVAPMSSQERGWVSTLIDEPTQEITGIAPPRQAAVLDAAADLVDLRYARELVTDPEGKAGRLRQKILERRALLGIPSPELPQDVPINERPDKGHDTYRVGAGAAMAGQLHTRLEPGATLDFRLTMHDLADPPGGYPSLGQLEFLALRGTWLSHANRLHLDRADLVHVASLQAFDAFAPKPSWRFRVGVDQRIDRLCTDCVLGTAQASGGLTFANKSKMFSTFLMTDMLVQTGPRVAPWHFKVPVGAMVGPLFGFRWQLGNDVVLLASAAYRYAANASRGWTLGWEAKARWLVGHGVALGAEGTGADSVIQATGMAYLYF